MVYEIAFKLLAGSAAVEGLTGAGSSASRLMQWHANVSIGLLTAWLPCQWVMRERMHEVEATVSNPLIPEVTYHCFCHVSLVIEIDPGKEVKCGRGLHIGVTPRRR